MSIAAVNSILPVIKKLSPKTSNEEMGHFFSIISLESKGTLSAIFRGVYDSSGGKCINAFKKNLDAYLFVKISNGWIMASKTVCFQAPERPIPSSEGVDEFPLIAAKLKVLQEAYKEFYEQYTNDLQNALSINKLNSITRIIFGYCLEINSPSEFDRLPDGMHNSLVRLDQKIN